MRSIIVCQLLPCNRYTSMTLPHKILTCNTNILKLNFRFETLKNRPLAPTSNRTRSLLCFTPLHLELPQLLQTKTIMAEDYGFTKEEMAVSENLGYPKAYAKLCRDRGFSPYSHGPPFTFIPYALQEEEVRKLDLLSFTLLLELL